MVEGKTKLLYNTLLLFIYRMTIHDSIFTVAQHGMVWDHFLMRPPEGNHDLYNNIDVWYGSSGHPGLGQEWGTRRANFKVRAEIIHLM